MFGPDVVAAGVVEADVVGFGVVVVGFGVGDAEVAFLVVVVVDAGGGGGGGGGLLCEDKLAFLPFASAHL